MSMDIFKEAKESVAPQWMKFVNPGDSVQGTYIGKIVGQKDGYGNEQVIYQLLQKDGSVMNVGFGLNKKFLNKDMESVRFGQIIGFKYKGKVQYKDKFGKMAEVKDYSLHQDRKIVDAEWLKDNADNMPKVTTSSGVVSPGGVDEDGFPDPSVISNDFQPGSPIDDSEDVPFSSASSLTAEDKVAVIIKLAKDRLGATTDSDAKEKVMEKTGLAFLPVNYDKIVAQLSSL